MNFKNLAMWAIIVFLTIGLYNMFKNPQTNIRSSNEITIKSIQYLLIEEPRMSLVYTIPEEKIKTKLNLIFQ